MGFFKQFLMVLASCGLLYGGSSVLGLSIYDNGVMDALDPHGAKATVNAPVETVRRQIYNYFSSAASTGFRRPVKADMMSDGSVRMLVGGSDPYVMTMTATFEPADAGSTKVHVTFDLDRLAYSSSHHANANDMDIALSNALTRALDDMNHGRDPETSLNLADIEAGRSGPESVVVSSTPAQSDGQPAEDAGKPAADASRPDPAAGQPDPEAGQPTVDTSN